MLDTLRSRFARAIAPTNGVAPSVAPRSETKGHGLSAGISFFSPDGTANIFHFDGRGPSSGALITRETAFAVAALCYAAIQYRADNIAEAPLRVAQLMDDGTHEFIPHELDRVLTEPSSDYDMAETLYLTVASLDLYARALWVKDDDRMDRLGQLMPFGGNEFTVARSDDRIYGKFDVTTQNGTKTRTPDEVVHFKYLSPYDRYEGVSPTDLALRHLNLGSDVENSVRRLFLNGMFPSVVISPDRDWAPSDDELAMFKDLIEQYQTGPANMGKPFVALGGSKVERVSFSLKDLVPDAIMDRLEATVCMAFGVAPVILGALAGLKNSPWSQMEEARRYTYEDTIIPLWGRLERAITRQLLRPIDPDPSRIIKFDTTRIAALQEDQSQRISDAQDATTWTLDERRRYAGQDPVDGEDGDWIEAASPRDSTTPTDED